MLMLSDINNLPSCEECGNVQPHGFRGYGGDASVMI
jgi:hypothetical protein